MPDKFADDGSGWGFDPDVPPHTPADLLEAAIDLHDRGEDQEAQTMASIARARAESTPAADNGRGA